MSDTPAASAPDDSPTGTPIVRPWRIVGGIVVTLCVLALVILLVGRAAGYADLERVLRDGDWRWLAVCAIGQVVVFSGYAGVFRTSLAFEGGPHVPPGLSIRVVLTSFASSQLVAAGGAAGLAVNYWALRRLGLAPRGALVRLLGLNTVVYLVFGVIGLVAALAALVTGAAPRVRPCRGS